MVLTVTKLIDIIGSYSTYHNIRLKESMCGITGWMNLKNDKPINISLLQSMTHEITHRGPDSEGYITRDIGALGFRRLSILDLNNGDQPISNESNTIFLICNGEIYNYKELKQELIAKQHIFKTETDIEVILHLYEEEGCELFKKLRGQFAIAIMDTRKQEFVLARDHFGIAPLFYTSVKNTLVFSSEIKSILKYPDVERYVNLMGFDQVLSLPGLANPLTMFKNIYSIPPGHYLQAKRRTNSFQLHEYWDIIFPEDYESNYFSEKADAVEQLENLLLNIVKTYTEHSDVEVAAFLSGGLDSSLITSMIKHNFPDTARRIFSIDVDAPELSEAEYQEALINHIGFTHEKSKFMISDIPDSLKDIIWHSECPLKETINSAIFKLARFTKKKGVKVVLTGSGADELFAGYLGYTSDKLNIFGEQKSERIAEERRICSKLWGDEYFRYENNLFELKQLKKKLFSKVVNDDYDEFDFVNSGVISNKKIKGIHPVNRRSYLDLKLRLPERILMDQYGHMTAAHGVEGRHPFLNVDIAEFAAKLNPNLKLRGIKNKYILKEISRKYVPTQITRRMKFVFVAQGSTHILQNKPEWIKDILAYERIRKQGYLNPDTVQEIIQQYNTPGFTTHPNYQSDLLMAIITFSLFLDVFRMPNLG